MPQAAAAPISGRPRANRAGRRGRRSFAANYRRVGDALRHRVAPGAGYRADLGDPDPAEGPGSAAFLRLAARSRDCGQVLPTQTPTLVGRLPASGGGGRDPRIPGAGAGGIPPELGQNFPALFLEGGNGL